MVVIQRRCFSIHYTALILNAVLKNVPGAAKISRESTFRFPVPIKNENILIVVSFTDQCLKICFGIKIIQMGFPTSAGQFNFISVRYISPIVPCNDGSKTERLIIAAKVMTGVRQKETIFVCSSIVFLILFFICGIKPEFQSVRVIS